MDILSELGVFGAGVALAIAVGGLFWKGDDGLSQDAREQLGRRLKTVAQPYSGASWPKLFVGVFDTVFSRHHLSLACFTRSFAASVIAVFCMLLIWASIQYDGFTQYFDSVTSFDIAFFVVFFLIFNAVPDFLSLLETRLLINVMAGTRNVLLLVLVLAFDLVITGVIFLFVMFVFFFDAPLGGVDDSSLTWSLLIERLQLGLTFSSKHPWEPPLGIFFYSTFFTSFWLWLFGLTYGALLLIRQMSVVIRFVSWLLPIGTKPIRSIGVVAAAFTASAYWIVEVVNQFAT